MKRMFIDLVRERKTRRVFRDTPLTEEQMSLILEAGDRAPSSRNLRPVRLVPIRDTTLIRRLAECKDHGADALRTATFAVVVAADEDVCDVWIEDASIATIFMQMEAQDLGIGSCWIQTRLRCKGDVPAEDNVRSIAGLDDGLRVLSIVAFGNC